MGSMDDTYEHVKTTSDDMFCGLSMEENLEHCNDVRSGGDLSHAPYAFFVDGDPGSSRESSW